LAEEAYCERCVHLAAGDRLYLYSDGLTDGMNPSGERFGDARLLEAIGRGGAEPLPEEISALLGEVARWQGGEGVQDDISLVAVELAAVPEPDGTAIKTRTPADAVPRIAEPALR
jgi:sigma-B regulation protein RsbU (phosphoserine phosphatase)